MNDDAQDIYRAAQHAESLMKVAKVKTRPEDGPLHVMTVLYEDTVNGGFRIKKEGTQETLFVTPEAHERYLQEAIRLNEHPPTGYVEVINRVLNMGKKTKPPRDTDTVLVERVEAARTELNSALDALVDSGMKVNAELHEIDSLRGTYLSLTVDVYRKIN